MAKAIALAENNGEGLERLKSGPAKLGEFLHDVRSEMKKVVSPTREEVQSQTVVVIATVFVFAAYFWAVDNVVGAAVSYVIKHLGAQ